MFLKSDEFVNVFEVSYSSDLIFNSFAILTSGGKVERWGSQRGSIKTWNFSEEAELIGLFGTQNGSYVNNLGVIVYNA